MKRKGHCAAVVIVMAVDNAFLGLVVDTSLWVDQASMHVEELLQEWQQQVVGHTKKSEEVEAEDVGKQVVVEVELVGTTHPCHLSTYVKFEALMVVQTHPYLH